MARKLDGKSRWIAIASVSEKFGRPMLYLQLGKARLEEVPEVGPEAIRKDAELARKHAAFRRHVANMTAGKPYAYEFDSFPGTFTLAWQADSEHADWYGPRFDYTAQFRPEIFRTVAKLATYGWNLTPELAIKTLHARMANRSEDPTSNWTAITPASTDSKYVDVPKSRYKEEQVRNAELEAARERELAIAAVSSEKSTD